MNNTDIRKYAKTHGVRLWQIADELGISEITMSRKLRYELSEDEKQKILEIIDELAKE